MEALIKGLRRESKWLRRRISVASTRVLRQYQTSARHWFQCLSDISVQAIDQAKMAEHTFIVIIAIIIGLLGGIGAVGFRFLIKFFGELFFGTFTHSVEMIHSIPWYILMCIPGVGGLIVGMIVHYVSQEVKGPGIPEVMEAVALHNGYIRPRVTIAKAFASAICIGSGGSVGREGPIVQIGSAIGSTIGQFLQVSSRRMQTFVACGASAGIAATFNAPVAGALFSVEVILGDFGVPQFSPIVISSVVGTVVSRHFIGDLPAFEVPPYAIVSVYELFFYFALGLLAGVVSYLFLKTLYHTDDLFQKIPYKMPGYFKTALGGLLVGIIGIWFPQVFGVGYETMNGALHSALSWKIMLVLIFAKLISTSITTGSGGSGGVFAPSLYLGALVGGVIGSGLHALFPHHTAPPGAYALVTMGALVAGTTHAPITAILIIFELTNAYTIILPLMISCIVSTLVTTKLQKESIYTMKLARRGINLNRGQELNVLKSRHVRDVMRPEFELIPTNMPFKALLQFVSESVHSFFFVINSKNKLIGILSLDDIRRVMMDIDVVVDFLVANDITNHGNLTTLRENDNLDHVMKVFGHGKLDELPVVAEDNPDQVIGTVWRQDVIAVYNKEIFKRDMADGVASGINMSSDREDIELVDDFLLRELDAPRRFVGNTIGDLDLRAKYGVEVILIKHREKSKSGYSSQDETLMKIIPYAQYLIKENDIFLVMGEKANLDMLEKL